MGDSGARALRLLISFRVVFVEVAKMQTGMESLRDILRDGVLGGCKVQG